MNFIYQVEMQCSSDIYHISDYKAIIKSHQLIKIDEKCYAYKWFVKSIAVPDNFTKYEVRKLARYAYSKTRNI